MKYTLIVLCFLLSTLAYGNEDIHSFSAGCKPSSQHCSSGDKTSLRETVCDTMQLKSGVRMIVKVSGVDKEKIHYYLCDSDNEAEFYIETEKVKEVRYANGLKDELKNPKDPPYDYIQQPRPYTNPQNYRTPELEKAKRQAELGLSLALGGLVFGPLLVAGCIMGAIARRKLKGKRGYERSYRLANVLTIIGCVILGIFVIAIWAILLGL
ncbi:MAG TPA: hypothetical protein VGF30_00810 [Bacteroidia bacterium]